MHYCAAEVDASFSLPSASPPTPNRPARTTPPLTKTSPDFPLARPTGIIANSSCNWTCTDNMQEELEDSLEELEDGLDVLMMLERAYDNTINAHVVPKVESSHLSNTTTITGHQPMEIPRNTQPNGIQTSHDIHVNPSLEAIHRPLDGFPMEPITVSSSFSSSLTSQPRCVNPNSVPLLAGSSTALLAILDHFPHRRPDPSATLHPPPQDELEDPSSIVSGYDAVIKIAHIGDCMGMLVRDEEIVWRSEEMWWGVSILHISDNGCASSDPFHT